MSNIDFGFQMLSSALSNLQQSRYRIALGEGLAPLGSDQTGQQGSNQQPDMLTPGSSAGMMDRAKSLLPYAQAANAKYPEVPVNVLLGVAAQESGMGANIGHPNGAYGPMQFIASTGRQYGLMTDADRADPAKSMMAAAAYLDRLKKQYGGRMDLALRYYNGVGQGSDPNYVNSVGRYARMFSGFGGTGGAPSDAAVASGGGGVTPPPPPPPSSADASSADQPMPPVDPQSPGSAAGGPQASASDVPEWQRRAMAGSDGSSGDPGSMVASADTGSATDVQPPVMPADDTPQLIEGLKRARANAGLPTVPDDFLAAQIKQMGTQRAKQVIQQLAGAQPRPPTGGAPRAVPPPSAPSPAAGAASAAGGPGAQRVTAGPVPTGVSRGAPGPAPPVGASSPTQVSRGAPRPAPPRGASTAERAAASPTGHPADVKPTPDDMQKANAGDESNPPWPGKEGLNPQGYFPYQSVYGNKFTLPQLIYNIKKANPGINPAVLAGAVLLAQPMLRDAANEHVRDYQETMREYMETQRETAAAQRQQAALSSKEEIANQAHEDRVAALSSLDAYRKATTQQRGERMAQEMLYKHQELTDREQQNAQKLDIARTQLALSQSREQRLVASQQLKDTLAVQRDLEQQKHNAIVDGIRTSSALTYPDREKALADEDARLKEATARLAAFERQVGRASQLLLQRTAPASP